MPRQVLYFERPERFVAGTVGQPGERTFYVQVSAQGRTASVALEKVQVAVLAERLTELLEEAARRGGEVPPGPGSSDSDPLEAPVEEEFRVGTMAIAWDAESDQVLVELQEAGDADVEPLSDAEEGPDVLRVRLAPEQARGFVERATRVVAAGRATCPLCEAPLDPEGHLCPRLDGYRPPAD